MKENSTEILADLAQRTNSIIEFTEAVLMNTSEEILKQRPAEGKWNILECLQHLNLYADFYLPVFDREINKSRNNGFKATEYFSSGPIGKFFYKSMLGENGRIKPMKTFKDKDPIGTVLPDNVVEEFLMEQKQYLVILKQSERVDLARTRIPLTITKLIKLKLGDALRFNIYHSERHIRQVKNILETVTVGSAVIS